MSKRFKNGTPCKGTIIGKEMEKELNCELVDSAEKKTRRTPLRFADRALLVEMLDMTP